MTPQSEPSGSRVARKIRFRAFLFLFLALVAGAGAVFLVRSYMQQMSPGGSGRLPLTRVVVAATDIPIGTPLEEKHLAVINWPAKHAPMGSSFADVKPLIGKTVRQGLVKGEAVLANRLADQKDGMGLTAVLATGKRAMAVKVDQVVGVAGFVLPGDFVDVITTMAPDDETKDELKQNAAKVSKIILQNIKVLAVGQQMATQGNKPVKVQVVTLEVTPEESERLALASLHGVVQLTMRPRVDQDSVATVGVTPLALLAPDEDAAEKLKEKPAKPKVDRSTEQWLAMKRRRAAAARPKEPPKPKEPPAPVVEVLRGDKIEERTLRPSADNK